MRTIYCIRHVAFEGPGIIEHWAEVNNIRLVVICLFNNEQLPNPELVNNLVVMGGPMSANDDGKIQWLSAEKRFIKSVIDHGGKVLGICLGAQLIANVLGANVYKNKVKEIGWWPISKTKEGHESQLLKDLPEEFTTFHWHGDTFDLPNGADHLLQSEGCDHQAFVVGNTLGLQFHMEMTESGILEVAERCADEFVSAPFIQKREGIEQHASLSDNHLYLRKILSRWFL